MSHITQLPGERRGALHVLIFDLDGVITTEARYWRTAAEAVWDILTGSEFLGLRVEAAENDPPQVSGSAPALDQLLPRPFIFELKDRAINSNWDVAYVALCLQLIKAGQAIGRNAHDGLLAAVESDDNAAERLRSLGRLAGSHTFAVRHDGPLATGFLRGDESLTGAALLASLAEFAAFLFNGPAGLLAHKGELWQLCQQVCQESYDRDYKTPSGVAAATAEDVVVEPERLAATLRTLAAHFTLGIATGRPREEALAPLRDLGLLDYFAPRHIVTYDEVVAAEAALAAGGRAVTLGKPDPFVLLKAIHPDQTAAELCQPQADTGGHAHVAFVGDTASDVLAAKRAGAISIGVLSGVPADSPHHAKRRDAFVRLGCDLVLDSVVNVPAALAVV